MSSSSCVSSRSMKATNTLKSYTCWNQLLTMMFGQLSNRESLRDLIVSLEAHTGKLYHLGIGKSVTRSNLSKANEQRDYRIFQEYATFMIAEARKRRIERIFELDGHVYAFDSTTIDLCLSVFEWAKFRKHKRRNQDAYALRCGSGSSCICAYYSC